MTSRLKKFVVRLLQPSGPDGRLTSRTREHATRYVVVQTDYGPMVINRNDTIVGRSLLFSGTYEKAEIEVLFRLVEARMAGKKSVTIIDGGANIGLHSVALARRFSDSARIVAIEAQDEMFRLLRANILLNRTDTVECRHAALGEVEDAIIYFQAPDYDAENNFGGLELIPPRTSDNGNMARGAWESVSSMTVDGLDLDVDIIKLDIEGMEMSALAGAAQTVEKCRPFVFCEMAKSEPVEIRAFFNSLNYREHPLDFNSVFLPEETRLSL
jgi:FkbM family methyltransferase